LKINVNTNNKLKSNGYNLPSGWEEEESKNQQANCGVIPQFKVE
jgi:hypothetical protein